MKGRKEIKGKKEEDEELEFLRKNSQWNFSEPFILAFL
jgi:hypothetical protein